MHSIVVRPFSINLDPTAQYFITIYSGEGFAGGILLNNFEILDANGWQADVDAQINLPDGINIVSGQKYTFKLSTSEGEMFFYSSQFNPYAGGVLAYTENGTYIVATSHDFYFETYVIPIAGPTTQLSTSCGATGLSLSSTIFATPIAGATKYRFNFSNASLNYAKSMVRSSGFANYPLSAVTGLQLNQTYDVTVQAYVGGVWTAVGNTCSITLNSAPPTTSLSSSCNAPNLTLTSTIYATSVAAATKYEFRFINPSLNYNKAFVRNSGFANYPLSAVTGLMVGQSYEVLVRAYVNGIWTQPGNACMISITGGLGRAANTEEVAVIENNNEMIAQEVEEVITEEVVFEVKNTAIKVSPVVEKTSVIKATAKAEFTVFPNPVSKSSVLNISFNTEEIGKVILTDITGRIITEQNFNTNLNSVVEIDLADKKLDNGIYNLSIIGNQSTSQKTIVVVE